jgi:hypothetical protein
MFNEQTNCEVVGAAHQASQSAQNCFDGLREVYEAPHVYMRPRVFLDSPGVWCCMYGECLADSPAGFGDSPSKACDDFDRRWRYSQQQIDKANASKEPKHGN